VKIFNDKTVVFLGRLGSMPQKLAKQEVERRGGRTQRSISPDTDFVVVGHFAYRLLDGGRLQWKLDQADAASARCISENQFLALSELREIDEPEKTLSVESLAAQAGLDATTVAQIVLFDVIEPNEGWCSFRDVVAAKEAARLIGQGASIAEIVAGNLALQRNPNEQPQNLAQVHLTRSEPDGLVMKIGEKLAELDGQMKLSLPELDNPSLDEMFDSAEVAEDAGELEAAERYYRQCVDIDKSDPSALFNLANVARERGKPKEARVYFERALLIDPNYTEAWYNLADLAESDGDFRTARTYLLKALSINTDFADALFNLARLYYRDEAFDDAVPFFERYLELDANSEWGHSARDHLAVCRQQLTRSRRRPA
jgi:tetratricopeptide (TPR) repeat protein